MKEGGRSAADTADMCTPIYACPFLPVRVISPCDKIPIIVIEMHGLFPRKVGNFLLMLLAVSSQSINS
jgi:hypothetical protein